MDEHKIFKTAVIPIILMVIGLKYFIPDLILSIVAGIGIYLIAFFTDRIIKKR